jgi:TonB family protein
MSNTDSRFMRDEELRVLLNKWDAPEAPGSLDERITASYRQSMSSIGSLSSLDPQRDSEVVKMKFCSTCQEQFADRFSFCPVDGTPLTAVAADTVAPPTASAPIDVEASYPMSETVSQIKPQATVPPAAVQSALVVPPTPVAPPKTIAPAAPIQSAAVEPQVPPVPVIETTPKVAEPQVAIWPPHVVPKIIVPVRAHSGSVVPHEMIGEYHLTMLEDKGLLPRLGDAFAEVAHNYQLTWPEFKRDPFGFTKRSFQGYGKMVGGFLGTRNTALALLIAVVAIGAIVGLLFVVDRAQSGLTSRIGLVAVGIGAFAALIALFATWLGRDSGAAVMGARPADSTNVVSGIAVAFALVTAVVGGVVFWSFLHQRALAKAQAQEDQMELTQMITDIPNEQPTPDEGTAGMAKGNGGGSKPKQEKAGGGGGGGREESEPASFGKLPQGDLRIPQVVAPDPHPPVIKNPALPMPATLDVDPALFPPDTRQLNYGDPKSKSTTPSSGSGTGNGIGNGQGGGVGPGSGGGYGPGNGGNTGGGPRNEGGGGPGGGGGGAGDYNKIFSGKEVTSKARVLEKPEPTYTESARKNQITGTVVLRAVFNQSGQVTNIHAVSGLPDGLTERAIAAAKNIRFVPATKDGHPVSMWMELQYNFNLY